MPKEMFFRLHSSHLKAMPPQTKEMIPRMTVLKDIINQKLKGLIINTRYQRTKARTIDKKTGNALRPEPDSIRLSDKEMLGKKGYEEKHAKGRMELGSCSIYHGKLVFADLFLVIDESYEFYCQGQGKKCYKGYGR